jgi:hypothetical protein
MHSHVAPTTLLAALLLAGTVPVAWAGDAATELFDEAEIERAISSDLLMDVEPKWAPLEPDGRFAFGTGAKLPDVKTPAFGKIETQSAIARAIKSGIPVSVDPAALPAELNQGHAFSSSFKAGIKAGFDAPVGDEMRLKDAAVETRLSLGSVGPSISWGWFTGIDMQAQHAGTNAVASGPQLKLGGDKLALTLNPKVAHAFGAGRDSEVAFAYAAGLKGELTRGVALGIEAFGTTSEVAPVPGMPLNAHRGGSSLYVGVGLTPPQKGDTQGSRFSLEVGALAGMTETTPDLTGRIKAGPALQAPRPLHREVRIRRSSWRSRQRGRRN